MEKIDLAKHDSMRLWAAENGFGYPERHVIRKGNGELLYKGKESITKYKWPLGMFEARNT